MMAKVKYFFEGRKEVEKTIEDNIETIKTEIKRIDIDKELFWELEQIVEDNDDDYESAYYNGIVYNFEDLYLIEPEPFSKLLKEKISEMEQLPEEERENLVLLKNLLNFMEENIKYSLIIKSEEVSNG